MQGARDDRLPATATAELFEQVYQELHAVARHCMRGERRQHTLQATAVVHEVFLQLVRARTPAWTEPRHLLAVAARAVRRVLINHALARRCGRRGGGRRAEAIADALAPGGLDAAEMISLGEAIDQLERLDPRQAQVVELRFFGGLSSPEVARVLGVSLRTIEAEWALARAWLRRALSRSDTP
jgi:RNA polymerase sigma-70 factor, ECF subfamily